MTFVKIKLKKIKMKIILKNNKFKNKIKITQNKIKLIIA